VYLRVGGWPTLSRRLGFEVELTGAPPLAILSKAWAAWAVAAVAATTIVLQLGARSSSHCRVNRHQSPLTHVTVFISTERGTCARRIENRNKKGEEMRRPRNKVGRMGHPPADYTLGFGE
jgi:hypothetical protein